MNEKSLADLVLEADPALPEFLLGRLASLLARQIAATSPAERTEISLAAIATFLDCVALGLSDQACDMIEQVSDGLVAGGHLAA
jgi:hypothetical protein